MNRQLLDAAEQVLSNCYARPNARPGGSCFYIPKSFLLVYDFQGVAVLGTPELGTQVIYKQITGDVPWAFRAFQWLPTQETLQASSLFVRIQTPDGRFLENAPEEIFLTGGTGSFRRVLAREILCPVGSKISLTLISESGSRVGNGLAVLFEGAYQFPARRRATELPVPSSGRYVPGENQNILAPCWMSGHGPLNPNNVREELFTYSSTGAIQDCTLSGYGVVSISLHRGETFFGRRLMFAVTGDVTASGTFLIRARADSGYALSDDFFDMAHLVGAAPMAVDWKFLPGETVEFDYQLVDVAPGSTGNMILQVYLEGVRSWKV